MNIYNDGKFSYKFLKEENIDELMNFIHEVYEELEDKRIFRRDSREIFLKEMSGEGKIVGVYLDGRLVAYRHLGIVDYENSLAKKVEDNIEIVKEKIIHHESAMVHRIARGNDIQNKTRKILEKELQDKGYRYFMSTVSPDNKVSYRNVLREDNGFAIVGLISTYHSEEHPDGVDRFVFLKDTKEPLKFEEEAIKVHPKDEKKIKELIKRKYYGMAFDGENIIFRKVILNNKENS